MSNVVVDKEKIDLLANAISDKSGEPLKMTLDEMVEAVDGIETGGGGITPTGNINITSAGVTDVTNYATVTVPEGEMYVMVDSEYYTESGIRKWRYRGEALIDTNDGDGTPGFIENQTYKYSQWVIRNAIAENTFVTPTESSQTIGGLDYMMEDAITVNAIPSNYVGSGITQRSSLDLTANGATVTAPAGYYSSAATKSVSTMTLPTAASTSSYSGAKVANINPITSSQYLTIPEGYNGSACHYVINSIQSGTPGVPTATKGAVSNHAITVTPSVTNVEGYISGGTLTGTGVSVAASEVVSGNLAISQNGNNIDVTNYATVSVSVSGGGSSGMQIATKTATPSSASASISFTGLSGEPTSFVVTSDSELATGASPYKTATVVFDGTNVIGQYITNTNNAQVTYDSSGFSKSYSNGTLTITGTNANFQANQYMLVYTYGGSVSNIDTKDVQVGSGATSITFTGLEDEPEYFSVVFKSNFSTSSGYQRVITVVYDGTSTYGLEMDSSAKHSSAHWSYTYNNGSLVVSSSGTNAGGYFHQPGYYQLTYAIGEALPYQKINKTYYASTSAQSEKIEPSTGYDAIDEVNVSIPAVSQTNLIASNIKSGTTVTISNGSTNLWSVTGSYTGSGSGSGVNIATATTTNSSNQNTSISFTLPSGRTPKAFFCRLTSQIARNSNSRYYYVFDMRWDGSSTGGVAGNTFYMSSGTLTDVTSGYSYSQSGTTFSLSSTGSRSASPGSFYNGTYELVYVY